MRLTAASVGKKIKGKTVLSNIDLDLKSGNIYGFVGPNGSGKTMLFRALSGLMSVTSGVVKLDEKVVRKDFSVLPNLGILLENVSLYPNLTGYENLLYLAKFSGKAGKSDIIAALESVGLDPDDKRKYGKYEFLQALLLPAQAAHSLHMRSKTEHFHRLDHFHFITFSGKEQKIPGQCFRIAGNVNHFLWS